MKCHNEQRWKTCSILITIRSLKKTMFYDRNSMIISSFSRSTVIKNLNYWISRSTILIAKSENGFKLDTIYGHGYSQMLNLKLKWYNCPLIVSFQQFPKWCQYMMKTVKYFLQSRGCFKSQTIYLYFDTSKLISSFFIKKTIHLSFSCWSPGITYYMLYKVGLFV